MKCVWYVVSRYKKCVIEKLCHLKIPVIIIEAVRTMKTYGDKNVKKIRGSTC